MQQHATNVPAISKHNERFDAAWSFRYGAAALAYTDHWITCEWCSATWLCDEGERLNSVCLDIESEIVELSSAVSQGEAKEDEEERLVMATLERLFTILGIPGSKERKTA